MQQPVCCLVWFLCWRSDTTRSTLIGTTISTDKAEHSWLPSPQRCTLWMTDRQLGHHAGFRRYERGGRWSGWQSRSAVAAFPVFCPRCRERTFHFPGGLFWCVRSGRVLRTFLHPLTAAFNCHFDLSFRAFVAEWSLDSGLQLLSTGMAAAGIQRSP